MKKIPLTVIVDDTNTLGKYYLSYLNKAGYIPSEVILLKYKPSFIDKAKIILINLSRLMLRKEVNIKLNRITEIAGDVNAMFDVEIPSAFDYAQFTSKLTEVSVGNRKINDDNLYSYLKNSSSGYFLFSGGGIANKKVLSLQNKKFIHTHPGIVPDVRGADCLFWSLLLRGHPGYSCFFMSPAIDEGDIIYQEEYSLDGFNNRVDLSNYKSEEIYKGLLNSLDLHYRAMCMLPALKKVLSSDSESKILETVKQNSSDGRMYFFMHKEIRDFVINKYFIKPCITKS